MLRKKLYLILLIVAAIAVGVYFLCFPSGKYRFVNQEIILNDCDGEDCAEVSINYLLCKSPRDFAKIFNDSLQRQLIRKLIAKDTLMDVEEAGNLFLSQYKSDKQQFEGIAPYPDCRYHYFPEPLLGIASALWFRILRRCSPYWLDYLLELQAYGRSIYPRRPLHRQKENIRSGRKIF